MSSQSGLPEWLDIALLFLVGAFLVVLSVVVIMRNPNKNRQLLSQSN
jgi:hypothetical protein